MDGGDTREREGEDGGKAGGRERRVKGGEHRWKWHRKVICLPKVSSWNVALNSHTSSWRRQRFAAHLLRDGNYASINPNKSHFRQEANCITGPLRSCGTQHQQCRAAAWFAPHIPQLGTEPVAASGPNGLLWFHWSLMKSSVIWQGCRWISATGSREEAWNSLFNDTLFPVIPYTGSFSGVFIFTISFFFLILDVQQWKKKSFCFRQKSVDAPSVFDMLGAFQILVY